MSPEEVQEVMHRQVYASAYEIANNGPVLPNHHEAYIQSICGALCGSGWYGYTHDEQQAKKNTIREDYQRMLADYLIALREHSPDTSEISRHDGEATLASHPEETNDALDKPAEEEVLERDVPGSSRDQVAREKLGPRYWTYEQYRADLVQRREEAPGAQFEPVSFRQIPLNTDKKTKTCPICGNKISRHNTSRHYRQTHARDPRHAIFCPLCPRAGPVYVEWRGDSTIDRHLWTTHKTVLNKKENRAVKDKDKGRRRKAGENATQAAVFSEADGQGEQAESGCGDEGSGAVGDDGIHDEEASDDDTIDEEVSDDDTIDEDMSLPSP